MIANILAFLAFIAVFMFSHPSSFFGFGYGLAAGGLPNTVPGIRVI
jgi:hypothetical protein